MPAPWAERHVCQRNRLRQATACVHATLDTGITTFDTADGYADTLAEVYLGSALKGQRRKAVEICTKAYFPTGPGQNERGLSRKHLRESIDGSLRRLQMDYVDVYQAHRYDYQTPLYETMENLCRHPQYSMLRRVIEAQVQPACEELGITQIVYFPLAQGVLTGKYSPGQSPSQGARAANDKADNKLENCWILPESGPSVADLKIQFVGSTGSLLIDGTHHRMIELQADKAEYLDATAAIDVFGVPSGFATESIRHFAAPVAGNRAPRVDGADGLAVTRLIQAMERSAAAQTPVDIDWNPFAA